MRLETEAIVCGLTTHGEHGGVVRLLTPELGLIATYVRGARGRRMRPVLIPGNLVSAQIRARTDAQLPQASLELVHSRAPILSEPLQAAAIEWSTAIVAAALAERQPYPRVYEGMAGLLDAVEAAPSARGWGLALARFEMLLLTELGYGRGGFMPEGSPGWVGLLRGLELSGARLLRELPPGRRQPLEDSRERLFSRLRRAGA
ncbi:MAG: DNA repair protein RecO [Alphaproteobacteria bacterium]